jgi:hypothetical protein
MATIARTTKKGALLISLIKVVLREIRIQDFQDDYLPMETLLADFPASDYAVVDLITENTLSASLLDSSRKWFRNRTALDSPVKVDS